MGVLLTGTGLFLLFGAVAYFIVSVLYRNDKDAQALGQLGVVLATACMYIMWSTCYLHQLYPLIRPVKRVE